MVIFALGTVGRVFYSFSDFVSRVVERGCYTEKDASVAVRELCEAVAVR
jgi:hypothetical protein